MLWFVIRAGLELDNIQLYCKLIILYRYYTHHSLPVIRLFKQAEINPKKLWNTKTAQVVTILKTFEHLKLIFDLSALNHKQLT